MDPTRGTTQTHSASPVSVPTDVERCLEGPLKGPNPQTPDELKKCRKDIQDKALKGFIKLLAGSLLFLSGAATLGLGALLSVGGSTLAIVSIPFLGAYGAGAAGVAVGAFVCGFGIALMTIGPLIAIGGWTLQISGSNTMKEAENEERVLMINAAKNGLPVDTR